MNQPDDRRRMKRNLAASRRARVVGVVWAVVAGFAFVSGSIAQAAENADPPGRTPVYLNWDFNCLTLGPAGIADLVRDAKEAGVNGINLRISNKGVMNYRTRAGACYTERLDAFGKDFDPLRVLVRECREQGLAANVWFDLFEAAYDPLILAHPEFSPQGRPGKPRLDGVPCYAQPEVRRHMLDLIDEIAAYRPDAVFFCTKSSHTPKNQPGRPRNNDSGFNPPVVARYRELYGVDTLKAPFDREKLGRVRGEFVIDFLVEAKRRLNGAGIKTIAGATVSGRVSPVGPNMLLDWRRILDRKAADALLMANSRGEYHVFYNKKGRNTFAKIRQACDTADIRFWPYIMSSGTHGPIADRVGFAGLLEYVPRQLDYLAALGGDAVLIHDLDLYSHDRDLRRAIWKAAGRRQAIATGRRQAEDVASPDPVALARGLGPGVPRGDFERDVDGFWFLKSSWTLAPDSPLLEPSFERHASDSRPLGWSPSRGGNAKLQTVYDWKVMHGDPCSGRTYSGRASLMLGASPGAANGNRTAAWTADMPVPDDAQGKQRLRVQVHGETLRNIESVGMGVECLDANGSVVSQLDSPCPSDGTFAWRPIETTWTTDARTKTLRVRLYLTAANRPDTRGRVWFDELTIEPVDRPSRTALTFPESTDREPASAGRRSARWDARPGWALVSVPFLVADEKKDGRWTVALRAQQPADVEVAWHAAEATEDDQRVQGAPTREKASKTTTCRVGREWKAFDLASPPAGHVQMIFRCHRPGVVWIDEAIRQDR